MQSLSKEITMSIRAICPCVLAVAVLFASAGAAQAAAPSNDDFANAITLTGSSGSESSTNVEATAEAGEPNNHAAEFFDGGDLGNTSVWYEWTAPASGLVGFDTDDPATTYDTVLGVYAGSLGSLNEVEFNDDYGGQCCTSRVVFNATAGQTYKVAVAGCCGVPATGSSRSGAFTLKWGAASRPGNDAFASATPIAGASGTLAGSNFDASEEPGDPKKHRAAGDLGADSVWYSWTAPSNGHYVFKAPGTSWNNTGPFVAAIGAYTGDLSGLNEAGYGIRSLGFDATAGTAYTIGLGGDDDGSGLNHVYWGDMGSYTLTWAEDSVAPATTITSSSGGKQSLTYSFTGSDNYSSAGSLRFECRLDGGAFALCKSPNTITPVGRGLHTVQVRAIDEAGNVDPSPAVAQIRVKGGPKSAAAIRRAARRRATVATAARASSARPHPTRKHPKG
jgi:hypothetical protein